MFTTPGRILKSGFKGFYRNFTISLSAIVVMVISLLSFATIYLVSALLEPSIQQLEDKVDVNVYFETNALQDQIDFIKTELEIIDEVKSIEFISREQALVNFKERQTSEVILDALESIGENPLGASFNIKAQSISQYKNIANYLSVIESSQEYGPIIESINYNQNRLAIDKLNVIINSVQRFGIVLSILLVGLSILITYNTIRLAIYTARNEVAVMRLVGASKFFARGPFIIEGMFYGIAAGIGAFFILWPAVFYAAPFLQEIFVLDLYQFFIDRVLFILLILLAGGVVLGGVSSLLAIRKYLDI